MSGLAIVVADGSVARLRTALSAALAAAALGGAARILLDVAAVPLLRCPIEGEGDAALAAAGLPTLAELAEEAHAAGIGIMLCQSGLARAGATSDEFDPRCGFGGMTGFLAALAADERLVAF